MTEDITVPLPSGLLGVVAGTRVQLVLDKGDSMQVTDGKDTFEVKKSQVTKEIESAAILQRQEQQLQERDDLVREANDQLRQKQERDKIEFLNAHPLGGSPEPTRPK